MTIRTLLHFSLPMLDEQANLVEKHKVDTLLFCPNPWVIRHLFINQNTGETVRARCNRWDCLFCGLRKVDAWRQLVKALEPTSKVSQYDPKMGKVQHMNVLTSILQAPGLRYCLLPVWLPHV